MVASSCNVTRKDYKLIAEVIRMTKEASPRARHTLARAFVRRLSDEYETFDSEKFLAACGIEKLPVRYIDLRE